MSSVSATTDKGRRSGLVPFVTGSVFLFCVFGFGVFSHALWWDDITVAASVAAQDGKMFEFIVASGRPVSAVLQVGGFVVLPSPDTAWILRLAALLGILATFAILTIRWRHLDRGWLLIFSAAIGFSLPTFQIYTVWATAWEFPWSMFLSVVAWQMWQATGRRLLMRTGAVLLVTVALLNYPPASLFLFALIAVETATLPTGWRESLKQTVQGLCIAAAGGVISLVIAFGVAGWLGITPTERVGFVQLADIPEKLGWMFLKPLAVGLRPFLVDDLWDSRAYLTVIPALVVLIVALVLQSRRMRENFLLRFVAIAVPLVFSIGPLLAVRENYLEFRFIPGYAWAICTLLVFSIMSALLAILPGHGARWVELARIAKVVVVAVLLGLAVAIISITNYRYVELVKKPFDLKTDFLAQTLSDCRAAGQTESIVIVEAAEEPRLVTWWTPIGRGVGLGMYSVSSDIWFPTLPEANVKLLDPSGAPISVISYADYKASSPAADVCYIRLEKLRRILDRQN